MKVTTFIKNYCKRSGISEDKLIKLGLFPVPCVCGDDSCSGWAMITKENIKAHMKLYID